MHQSNHSLNNRLRQSKWTNSLLVGSFSIAVALASSPAQGSAVAYASQNSVAQKVNAYLSTYQKLGWFSGSVLIAKGNKILLNKSYGMSDYTHHKPITSDTEYEIGGITEQFTAMAILQLQQKGLLNVNDKLGKYLPQYPRWKDITIKELLTHTSGIPDYFNDGIVPSKTLEKLLPYPNLISLFANKSLDFPPGSEYEYSLSNYAVLGYLVQKLSGMSYVDYLKQNILKPLGMKHTGLFTSPHMSDLATGYAYTGVDGAQAKTLPNMYTYGDAGLYSTSEDMLKWSQALYTTKLASKLSMKQMFSHEAPLTPDGYGWVVQSEDGHTLESQSGRVAGYESFIVRYPTQKLIVICLSNSYTIPMNTIQQGVLDLSIFDLEPLMPNPTRSFVSLRNKQLSKFVGRYEFTPSSPSALPRFLTVTAHGEQLYVSGTRIYPTHVSLQDGYANFVSKLVDATYTFNLTHFATRLSIQRDGSDEVIWTKVK